MNDVPAGPFLVALFAAPLVPAVFTMPLALFGPLAIVPAFFGFAIYFGAASYLLFGGAAFIVTIRRDGGEGFWLYAIPAHIASLPFAGVVFWLYDLRITFPVFAAFGLLVAPLWGACFGWIYGKAALR